MEHAEGTAHTSAVFADWCLDLLSRPLLAPETPPVPPAPSAPPAPPAPPAPAASWGERSPEQALPHGDAAAKDSITASAPTSAAAHLTAHGDSPPWRTDLLQLPLSAVFAAHPRPQPRIAPQQTQRHPGPGPRAPNQAPSDGGTAHRLGAFCGAGGAAAEAEVGPASTAHSPGDHCGDEWGLQVEAGEFSSPPHQHFLSYRDSAASGRPEEPCEEHAFLRVLRELNPDTPLSLRGPLSPPDAALDALWCQAPAGLWTRPLLLEPRGRGLPTSNPELADPLEGANLAKLEKLARRLEASRGPAHAPPTASSSGVSAVESAVLQNPPFQAPAKRGRQAAPGPSLPAGSTASWHGADSRQHFPGEALFGMRTVERRRWEGSADPAGPRGGAPMRSSAPLFFRPGAAPARPGAPLLPRPLAMQVAPPALGFPQAGLCFADEKAYTAQLRGWLLQLAHASSTGNQAEVLQFSLALGGHVHPLGTPMQRLGVHLMDAITQRLQGYSPEESARDTHALQADPHKRTFRLNPAQPSPGSARPLFHFVLASVMGLVVDSVGSEDNIHILDFTCSSMWGPIIQELARLAAGRGAQLLVKFTACVPPQGHPWGHQRVLPPQAQHRVLRKACRMLPHVQLQFQAITALPDKIQPQMLLLDPGDALVVYFGSTLTAMVDVYASSAGCPKDNALQAARRLNPRAVGLVEWSGDMQHPFFVPRFRETLDMMLALYETFQALSPSTYPERTEVEEVILGHELKFLLACQGPHHFVRYESYDQLTQRMMRLGYGGLPASSETRADIARGLTRVPRDLRVVEHRINGCHVAWRGRPLLSASAWRPLQGPLAGVMRALGDQAGADFAV